MPQFYQPLGWGICGRQTTAQTMSRNLPQVGDGLARRPRVMAGAAVAPGRARRFDVAVRPRVLPHHRLGRSHRGILALDDRPSLCARHLGRVPGRGGQGLRVHQGPQDPRDRLRSRLPAGSQVAAGPGAGRGARAGLSGSERRCAVNSPGDRGDSRGLGPRHRSGCLRRCGLDVPHSRPGRVLEMHPARSWPPRGRGQMPASTRARHQQGR